MHHFGGSFSFIFESQYFKTVSGFGNRRILTLVLAVLDKGDEGAHDEAHKLFVIYCATAVSEPVSLCV